MKVIELLVKMANKEKLPKKVLINDKVYYLLKRDDKYIYSRSNDARDWECDLDHSLNICICLNDEVTILDKVEIIEDKPKKIKKLNFNKDWKHGLCLTYQYRLVDTLNEVIDTLNSLVEKSEKENEELEKVIKYYKNKSERLQNKLKQKDNAIDKYTKCLKLNIKIYENRVMEHSFDDDEIIMNCYQNALEKLQQAKGGCDDEC